MFLLNYLERKIYDITYMLNLKRWYKWTYLQNRNKLTDLHSELMVMGGGQRGKGIVSKFGMDVYTLLYLKWITNKDLLYSTGNSTQCYMAAWMGEEFGERIGTCICITESHMYNWKLAQYC